MGNSQLPNRAATLKGGVPSRMATALAAISFACLAAVMLTLFALPATSYAAEQHEVEAVTDETVGLKVLQPPSDNGEIQPTAASDAALSDYENLLATGYIATAKTFNEAAGLKPDDPGSLPEDSTNIFLVINHGSMSGETTYCMLIMTEEGTYLIGRPYAADQYEGAWVSGMYSSLDANSYKENLVFYSPTTLSEQLDENQFISSHILDILKSMTKVTAANVGTIPFPDPATFSAESPETFLLIPLLYDAPALPQDFNPAKLEAADSLGGVGSGASDTDSSLYYLPCYTVFTAASPDEVVGHDMVSGAFEINDKLLSSGMVSSYLWSPELDSNIGAGYLSDDDGILSGIYEWKVPEGSEITFASWIENDTTISTGAALSKASNPSMVTPLTDIYFSPDRSNCQFYGFTPEYDFKVGITELVPYPGKYGFIDVPASAWYSSVVAQANRYGYMTGWDVWYFGPEQTLSRAMAATITYRLAGEPGLGDEAPQVFSDVPTDQWYSYPIYWASDEGIVHGYGDGTFAPDANCTREQFAVMLFNWAKAHEGASAPADPAAAIAKYRDASKVSAWALDAVAWAAESGIMGLNTSSLSPQGSILRCEAAAMSVRAHLASIN